MSLTPGFNRGLEMPYITLAPTGRDNQGSGTPLGLKQFLGLTPPADAGGYRHCALSERFHPKQ